MVRQLWPAWLGMARNGLRRRTSRGLVAVSGRCSCATLRRPTRTWSGLARSWLPSGAQSAPSVAGWRPGGRSTAAAGDGGPRLATQVDHLAATPFAAGAEAGYRARSGRSQGGPFAVQRRLAERLPALGLALGARQGEVFPGVVVRALPPRQRPVVDGRPPPTPAAALRPPERARQPERAGKRDRPTESHARMTRTAARRITPRCGAFGTRPVLPLPATALVSGSPR
jgi:hypothetical protein